MKAKTLYLCSKRDFGVVSTNYCDWYEKKRKSLTKRCCKNCSYFTNEQVKQNNKKKDSGSSEESEIEAKKTKKSKE